MTSRRCSKANRNLPRARRARRNGWGRALRRQRPSPWRRRSPPPRRSLPLRRSPPLRRKRLREEHRRGMVGKRYEGNECRIYRGTLDEVPLPKLLRLFGATGQEGVVVVVSPWEDVGKITMGSGVIRHAT